MFASGLVGLMPEEILKVLRGPGDGENGMSIFILSAFGTLEFAVRMTSGEFLDIQCVVD